MNDSPYIFDATIENFQQGVIDNSNQVPVIVDFWADWCQPCKMLIPVLEKLIDEFDGKVILAKVNSDVQQELAQQYAVRSIPTVKIFRHGNVVGEFTGVQNENYIKALLERHIPTEADKLREQAMELISNKNTEEGRKLLEQAADLAPQNTMIQIDLAQLDADLGHYQAANERLHNLGIEAREKPEVTGLLAKVEFAAAAEAASDIDTLQQQIDADPKNSEARYQLAAKYVLDKNYQAALDQLLLLLMRDRQYQDDAGRRAMISIFNMLGNEHELTSSYRRKMFNAMH